MIPFQPNIGLVNPVFPGGATGLERFIDQNKHAPSVTASGTVFVEFIVNPDGSVSDFVVLKGLGIEADIEAVRIVSSMPMWIPGTANGQPSRVKFVLPINF